MYMLSAFEGSRSPFARRPAFVYGVLCPPESMGILFFSYSFWCSAFAKGNFSDGEFLVWEVIYTMMMMLAPR